MTACHAPSIAIAIANSDGSIEVATDSATDAPTCMSKVLKEDSAICDDTRDEDGDCVPDECDACPNVFWDPILKSRGVATASDECAHPSDFAHIRQRFHFDGFTSKTPWIDLKADPISGEKFDIDTAKGVATIGTPKVNEHTATLNMALGLRDVVATAVIRIAELNGPAGMALRHAPAPISAYRCVINGARFALHRVSCATEPCTLEVLRDAGGASADKALPVDVDLLEPFVMRIALAKIDGGVKLQCQIFPVPATIKDVRGTLRSIDVAANTIDAVSKTDVLTGGDPGFYVKSASLVIDSIDILTAP